MSGFHEKDCDCGNDCDCAGEHHGVEEMEMVSALFPLTSSESKRLIAKGVAALPEVRRALKKGRLVIAGGTTNAFVAEELLGVKLEKALYTAGIITGGKLCTTPPEKRIRPYCLKDGKPVNVGPAEMAAEFEAGDVFIKGAGAVDHEGHAGVLVASPNGGTIGTSMGHVLARGAHLIVPVGLEKMIPSVIDASQACGTTRFKYSYGASLGFIPLVNATVITEIDALWLLTGVTATHAGSGGVGGSEGSVVLAVEGTEEEVDAAFNLIKSIKGEPPVEMVKRDCDDCTYDCTIGRRGA